jgi:ATP/maltotriose-dependent transcriptional regulator MalT
MEKSYRFWDGTHRREAVTAYPVHDLDSQRSFALKMGQDIPAAKPSRSGGAALTRRERQVLGLLAQGRTNPEIAGTLAISRHTVKSHVIGIFSKLGVKNRAQAALQAARLDLI